MATSATSAITFTGSSSFSSSFQQVLTRAVQIASMPLTQMQTKVSDLQDQETALSSLQSTFSSLQTALQSVQTAAQGSLTATATTSDVSGTAQDNALPGTYTIQVDSLGSSTTALSQAGSTTVTDSSSGGISNSTNFTLTIDGTAHTITTSGTSLQALATAINNSGLGVQATIVNVGASSGVDYRLAVTSSKLGPETIQLNDGSTDLLQTMSTGTYAQYKINGGSTDVQSDTRDVTLSPGLSVTLEKVSTSGPTTITVGEDYSALQTALTNLATAYNNAVDALSAQRGQNAGVLSGQSIVRTLQSALTTVSQYTTASGTIGSLTALGLVMGQDGHLSLDSSTFDALSTTDVQTFLGSTTSSGFLKSANDAINSVADTTSGNIQAQLSSLQNEVTNQNTQITQEQQRISDLQANLQAQLSAADATIATLEAQKTYYTDLFAAQYLQNNPNSPLG